VTAMSGSNQTQLELRRLPGERSVYQLGDVGTVRRHWTGWRSAVAEAGDRRWTFTASGIWRSRLRATDQLGAVVGEYLPRAFRAGGTVQWYGRELTLRSASIWRRRLVLSDAGRDIVTIDARSGGRRPVTMTVRDPQADAGLLLFTAVLAAEAARRRAADVAAPVT
jgi:hypothetical protein